MSLENEAAPAAPTPTPTAAQPSGPPPEALAEAAANRPAPGRERGPNGRFVPKADNRESSVAKISEILNNAPQIDESPADALDAEGQENSDDQTQPADESSPPVDPAGETSEGLSEELRQLAEAVGVNPAIIGLAKSDDALRVAIAMADSNLIEAAPQAQQPPTQPPQHQPPQSDASMFDEDLRIKFLLDEESADPEDPYFKQAKHTTETIADLQDVVSMLAEKLMSYEKRDQASRRDEQQRKFDDILDATNWAITGKRENLTPQSPEAKARAIMFAAYKRIAQALPDLPAERAVELAHEQVFKKKPTPKQTPQEAARIAALKRSNAQILGSGSGGPPAPERPLTPRERFERNVNRLTQGRL